MSESISDSSDDEWEGVEDNMDDTNSETICLFCTEQFNSPEAVFQHCHSQHMFDIVSYSKRMSVDSISYIKLVNYIRLRQVTSSELLELPENNLPWRSDRYMKPVNSEDPLLVFDFESFMEENMKERGDVGQNIIIPQSHFEDIMQKFATKELQLQNAHERIDRMKEAAKHVLSSNQSSSSSKDGYRSCESDNDYYFSSYDHFSIHHEMLQDKVRTQSYCDAILNNKEVFANKIVLDVGCGTGILSMFAAKACAKQVFAVDKSDIIYQAMDIIRENGLESIIDLRKGRIEDSTIPDCKVDAIVSEWMGYFLLFEGMLESIVYARDKYLSVQGLILPDKCTLYLTSVSDLDKYKSYVSFWDDVYGFKMSVMKREVVKEAVIEAVKADVICSNSVAIKELDLFTCSAAETEFTSDFIVTITKTCQVTALVGYFDCHFDRGLNAKVILSTSPMSEPTHWKQTIFLLPEPVNVTIGDKITGKITCRKNRRDPRTLVIKIYFGDVHNQYYLA